MMDRDDARCSVPLSEPLTQSPSTQSPSTRILAIDDDPHISRAIQCRFAACGVDVLRAFDGLEGIEIAVAEKPDLIITDLTMPRAHGEEVVRCLKNHPETGQIPIIVVTGEPDGRLERKLRNLGVDDYLNKPVEFEVLRAAVEALIDLP